MRKGSKAFSPAITLWLSLGERCDTGACLNSLHVTSNVVIQAGMCLFTPVCAHNKCTNEKAASGDVWTLNTGTFLTISNLKWGSEHITTQLVSAVSIQSVPWSTFRANVTTLCHYMTQEEEAYGAAASHPIPLIRYLSSTGQVKSHMEIIQILNSESKSCRTADWHNSLSFALRYFLDSLLSRIIKYKKI